MIMHLERIGITSNFVKLKSTSQILQIPAELAKMCEVGGPVRTTNFDQMKRSQVEKYLLKKASN